MLTYVGYYFRRVFLELGTIPVQKIIGKLKGKCQTNLVDQLSWNRYDIILGCSKRLDAIGMSGAYPGVVGCEGPLKRGVEFCSQGQQWKRPTLTGLRSHSGHVCRTISAKNSSLTSARKESNLETTDPNWIKKPLWSCMSDNQCKE
jgi:hypothetical protein